MITAEEVVIIVVGLGAGWYVVSLIPFDKWRRTSPGAGQNRSADESARQEEPASRPRGPPTWFEVLHVSKDATLDEIKQAYRLQMSRYHPDKVAALGQELRELAELKAKAINEAYQEALSLRGGSS